MKRLFANTLFARLLALIVVSVLASHLLPFALLFALFGGRILPPPSLPPNAIQSAPRTVKHPEARLKEMPNRPPPAGFLATLGIELLTLAWAAWFGAKVIARPIQQLSKAATE